MKKPVLCIAGPTASGKTDAGVYVARALGTEIISADSMQIYKYMDIGTAKPSQAEMRGIRHHLIDERMPDEAYSVSIFKELAKERIDKLHRAGKLPVVVGGTGFYIRALLHDNDFNEIQDTNTAYRAELRQLADTEGAAHLHTMLAAIDPVSAANIHPNNIKRVMRAIEYHRQTGTPISAHNEREKSKEPYYNALTVILHMERPLLYKRIERRVDRMIQDGLPAEAARLYEAYGDKPISMQGLGYKEIIPFLKGERSLETSIDILKRDTRHFAKRQITWFKYQCDGVWLDVTTAKDPEQISERILGLAQEWL